MKKTIHCYISGRVQGVFFRAHTREQAMLHGVTGWVRNLADGRVEVMACGEEGPLKLLHEWLQRGPAHARVLKVEVREVACRDIEGFTVR